MDTQIRDSVHIFSEFMDPERKRLIADLVRQIPELTEINRGQLFMLWFCDIDRLREIVDGCQANPDWWAIGLLTSTLKRGNLVDLAGIWAGKCHPKIALEEAAH